jgi:opacity protein-like surface antigen
MCMRSFVTTARLTLAAVTLAALAGSATAADLGARAPAPYQPSPPPPPLFSWTGCYIGGNIGGGWASHSSNDVTGAVTGVIGADLGSHTASGFIGGGQIGCDYQAGVWVFGVQGMFDGSGMQGSNTDATGLFVVNSNIPWLAKNAVLADPKLEARLVQLGGVPMPMTPAQFGKLIADETEKWAKVVKFSGAKPD